MLAVLSAPAVLSPPSSRGFFVSSHPYEGRSGPQKQPGPIPSESVQAPS